MRRSILLLSLMLAASCSQKSDDKQEAAATAEPAPDKGTPGEAADETPPQSNPDRPATPPTAPPVAVDCETLLTAEDVNKACGGKPGDIAVSKHAMESGTGATTCVRNAGPVARGKSSVHFALNSAPGSPDGARALLELSKEGARPAAGVGDGAYLRVREEAATGQTAHELEVVKGALWFKLGYVVDKGDKKPLCSDDGLVALGKTVAGRLP